MRIPRVALTVLPSLLIVGAFATACGQTPDPAGDIVVTGTSTSAHPIAGGLRYTADVKLVDQAPTRLQATITMTNVTDETIHAEYGACPRLLAFDSAARSGAPAWDSADRRDPVTGAQYACPDILYQREVLPGETISPNELLVLIPSYEIVGHALLGRSLPDGLYYWLAQMEVNKETIDVPAGQATLTMNEPPLPSERVAGGPNYRMGAPTTTTKAGIEATLTVTNNGDEDVDIFIARDCPVNIHLYHDKARRDAAYVAGEPDWRPKGICVLEMDAMRFSPGESQQFTVTVPVAEILGDSLDDGRYYVAALVWLRDQSLMLSAGEVELRR